MFTKLKLAGTVAALALAATVFPASGASSAFPQSEFNDMFWSTQMMRRMDANKDGMVSRDEYLSYLGRQFDMMDTGRKRMLTATQFTDKGMMSKTFPAHAGE